MSITINITPKLLSTTLNKNSKEHSDEFFNLMIKYFHWLMNKYRIDALGSNETVKNCSFRTSGIDYLSHHFRLNTSV